MALLLAADWLVGSGLKFLYEHQAGEDYRMATVAIREQRADVLILGPSRARDHYNPSIIEDTLGMSAYNAGRDGCFLVYQWAQFHLILDRHTPKMVVLDVQPYDMNAGSGDYDRLSALLPYQEFPSFERVMREKSPYEKIKCWSRIYPYNSMLLKLVDNMKDKGTMLPNGYAPHEGVLNEVMQEGNGGASEQIDLRKVGMMEEMVSICRKKKIKLRILVSPFYLRFTRSRTLEMVDSICRVSEIPYRCFLNDTAFADGGLFFTPDHMNSRGADKYSRLVASWLRSLEEE